MDSYLASFLQLHYACGLEPTPVLILTTELQTGFRPTPMTRHLHMSNQTQCHSIEPPALVAALLPAWPLFGHYTYTSRKPRDTE